MKNMFRRNFIGMLVLAMLTVWLPSLSAAPKSEDELIADLASPKDGVVTDALKKLEKEYPTSTKALPAIKKLLADPRPKVARVAARVLGEINAEVSESDLKNICELLKSTDKWTVIDGLKALRGLKAQSVIPQIVPLLKSPDKNIIRDACRTLAVLGNKSLVPDIQPLLSFPDLAVQKDAADAISILKEK